MKRRAVVLSSAASDDVAGLLEYKLATEGHARARALDAQLDGALATLDRMAGRGRIVPELRARGVTLYRELIRGPYRIVYRLIGDEVWVLAIVDGRRDLESLLYERARR